MSTPQDRVTEARARICEAFDPRLFREAGHRLADALAEHLARAQASERAVLPWIDPEENIRAAVELLRHEDRACPERLGEADAPRPGRGSPPPGPAREELVARFSRLVATMLERGLNLHDPRYIGHQVPAPVPLGGLFDAVGSVMNQVMAIYEVGPWSTSVEEAMVRELGEAIGWEPGQFAGVITHGGSLANLTALLTARNARLGRVWEDGLGGAGASPVLLAHEDVHYSVARAAGILGLGSRQIVRVGLDALGRMDPERLDDALRLVRSEERPVIAVVACACSTPIGAFDPLGDIADVCRRHGVWLHVDAAHGGSALLSEEHRHLVHGLDRGDSIVWDAHKMLFVPSLCAFVFYRDKRHRFEAFRQDAPYLFDPTAPGLAEYDSGLKTVECTKRAAAFGIWGIWSLFGKRLLVDMVDVTFGMGRAFYEKLRDAEDFEPLHEPQCNIVVFRHVPRELRDASAAELGAYQLELRRRVIQSGEFYIVPIKRDGAGALRVTIINPLTTPDHLDQLMESLRRHGRELVG